MRRFLVVLACSLAVGILSISTVGAGILRYTQAFPTTIDPAVGMDYSSTRALTVLYDTLVYPDTTGAPQPHLAERWDISADGTVWTFYLRPGILFHDGTEVTAEDVAFSVDRLLAIGEGWSYLFDGRIESAEVVDKYVAKITLTAPFGPFLTILYKMYVANKDLIMANTEMPGPYGEFGDYGRGFLVANDAGSGPYMVKEFSPEDYLLMERYWGYWSYVAPKAPDEIKQIGTTEAVTIRALMSGQELEISDQWQAQENLDALDKIEGVDIARLSLGGYFNYMIHTRKPPTDDIHFRKAMAYATDYETLMTKIYPGFPQARGPVSSSVPGFDPTVFQYSYDLEKAREELKQSKYYDQLDQYPVEIHWISVVPTEEKVALLLQAGFAQIGIKANVVRVPLLSVLENMAAEDTSPHLMAMFMPSDFPEAGATLHSRYHSVSVRSVQQNEWLLDPEYDRMIEEALSTSDQDARFAKYAELQHYIVDLCPTLFLLDDVSLHAYQAAYVDWPAARGEGIPIIGYDLDARWIQLDADKQR